MWQIRVYLLSNKSMDGEQYDIRASLRLYSASYFISDRNNQLKQQIDMWVFIFLSIEHRLNITYKFTYRNATNKTQFYTEHKWGYLKQICFIARVQILIFTGYTCLEMLWVLRENLGILFKYSIIIIWLKSCSEYVWKF